MQFDDVKTKKLQQHIWPNGKQFAFGITCHHLDRSPLFETP